MAIAAVCHPPLFVECGNDFPGSPFLGSNFSGKFMAVQETDQPAFSTLLHSPTNCIGEEGRELLQNQLCPDTLPEREREREWD